jgi:hypothetical protein
VMSTEAVAEEIAAMRSERRRAHDSSPR